MPHSTRDPRRTFNGSERAAMYVESGGACALCGAPLDPSWHGDHIDPHSLGGITDVTNGQALCPPCNLKKGADGLVTLRPWQEDALEGFMAAGEDFLTVATPGAGKTTFALVAAERLRTGRDIDRVIVVVPTDHLKVQWATAATKFGIHLDHKFTNSGGTWARDYDGAVITYQTVANQPMLWRSLTAKARTLVILDEIHHAAEHDTLQWGRALAEAFEPATRRLMLSGTPFRRDGHPIAFVKYGPDGLCVTAPGYGYDYGYGRALRDGGVVRPIEFVALNSEVQWRNAGSVEATTLADATSDNLAKALTTALSPSGDWIPSVLTKANEELSRIRDDVPDAGGLVIASDQRTARAYADLLRRITGTMPALAVSDDKDASDIIKRFTDSADRWIVAVKMVSEGVDIPRLSVGVYATNIRSEMFVRQVVGRFVRLRDPGDEGASSLYIPSIEPLLSIAKKIEETVDAALREAAQATPRDRERDAQEALFLDPVMPLTASEAEEHSIIRNGEDYDQVALELARKIRAERNIPASTTDWTIASILEGGGLLRPSVQTAPRVPPVLAPVPLADQKKAVRKAAGKLVARLNRITGEDYKDINARLNRLCGGPIGKATLDELDQRVEYLSQWIEDSR